MDARLVWDTWRRILTDDQLVEQVLHPGDFRDGEGADLTAAELAILTDYASTPAATDSNIGMYRRGLVRNALAALAYVPLTRCLLYSSGLDDETVAVDFVQSTRYFDYGPHVWRIAGKFVAYLATLPEFAERLHQDVLALDAAAVLLAQRLGQLTVVWPESAAIDGAKTESRVGRESRRFVASRAAVVVSSSYDLTPWIESPDDFDAEQELEPSPKQWLIYFPAADAAHRYAELSERAARAFNLLSAPKTAPELSVALDGLPTAEVIEVIDALAELGLVACDGDA